MSDACGNVLSEKFEKYCRRLNIEHVTSSSYHHQSNGQVTACIKIVKQTMKICCDTIYTSNSITSQNNTTRPGLPSPATLLFNCPLRGIMLLINILLISIDHDDDHHKSSVERQTKMIQNMILPKL